MSLEPGKDEPIYTIGIAAKRLGISVSTLRMYEREGLIVAYKTETKRRVYSQRDIEWINRIKKMIKINGLNIEGIRRLLALIPCWEVTSCSAESREKCKAYLEETKPCWMSKESNGCEKSDSCRECEVYIEAWRCEKLKEMFKLMEMEEDEKTS